MVVHYKIPVVCGYDDVDSELDMGISPRYAENGLKYGHF